MAMAASTLLPQQQPKRQEQQQQQQQQQAQQQLQAQHHMLQPPQQADDMLVEASKAAAASTMTPTRRPSRRPSTFSYPQVVASSDPVPGSAGRSASLTLDVAVSLDTTPNRTSSMSEISIRRKSQPPRRPSTFSYPQMVAAPSPEADDSSASLSIFPSEMEFAVRMEAPRSRTSSNSSMSSNSSHSQSNIKPPRRLSTFSYPHVMYAPAPEEDGPRAPSSLFIPEIDVAVSSNSSHSQSNIKLPRRPSTFSYPQTFVPTATSPPLALRALSGGDSSSSASPVVASSTAATTNTTTPSPPPKSHLEFTLPLMTIEPRPSTVVAPLKEGDDPNQTPSQQSSNSNSSSSLPCPKPTRRTVRFPSRRTAMEDMRKISRLSNYTINDITAVWGDKEEHRERRQALYHDVQELSLGRQSSDKNVNFTTLGIADQVGPEKVERRRRRQAALKAVLGGQLAKRLSSLDSATTAPVSFDELEPLEASTSSPTTPATAPVNRGRSFSSEMAKAYHSVSQEAERKARQAAVELHRNVKTLLKMTSNSSLSASVDSGDDNHHILRDDIDDIIIEEGSQDIRFFQEEMEDYKNRSSSRRRSFHGLQPDDDLLQGLSFEDDRDEEGIRSNYNDDFDEEDFMNNENDDEDRHAKDDSQDETEPVDLWQGFRVIAL